MNISNIQPVPNESALFIAEKKILLIADLHIGIEKELREKGLNVASQTNLMIDKLKKICKKYKPKEIIILGDIKHNIPTSTIQERNDVRNFLKEISFISKIKIIPGNHDGNIHRLCEKEINILKSDGYVYENIGLFHGHRWPNEKIMNCEHIIFAHTHPVVKLTDRLGFNNFEPCWLKGTLDKNKSAKRYPNNKNPLFLIVPAFNPLCGGVAVNSQVINGPLGKIIDIKNSDIFLIDGSFLGKVKSLK